MNAPDPANPNSNHPIQVPDWQPEKQLRSGDRVWFLTDVERFTSSYLAWSTPQVRFKVGIYDLETGRVGFAVFGKDIAYMIVKAGIAPPPWTNPAPFAIELRRDGHDEDEKGRYTGTVTLLPLDPAIAACAGSTRRRFAAEHSPNVLPGVWDDLVERAAKENAIEAAVRGMNGTFSAGDVKAAIGDPDAEVTPVLQKFVREGKLLPPTGTKRWTRYELATPLLADDR